MYHAYKAPILQIVGSLVSAVAEIHCYKLLVAWGIKERINQRVLLAHPQLSHPPPSSPTKLHRHIQPKTRSSLQKIKQPSLALSWMPSSIDNAHPMLSSDLNHIISGMKTGCHNIAGGVVTKVLRQNPWGDAQRNHSVPADTSNRNKPLTLL